jgi:hypothetical protein
LWPRALERLTAAVRQPSGWGEGGGSKQKRVSQSECRRFSLRSSVSPAHGQEELCSRALSPIQATHGGLAL